MIEAVLLDLDGTILKHEVDDFLKRYFTLIQKRFDHLFPNGRLVQLILTSTEKMLKNGGEKTNKEVFWGDFLSQVPWRFEDLEPEFEKFYLEDFPSLNEGVTVEPQTSQILAGIKQKGYKLALATNPLFPRIAIEERLRWAGVESKLFDFVASYETMHYCKPNPDFFLELADLIKVEPQSCLMVGNEVELDLRPAQRLGMKTFLVRNGFEVLSEADFTPDFQGELEDLPDILKLFE